MKKTIAGILIVSLLFGASACKEKTGKATETERPSETETSASSEVTGSETEASSSETSETTEPETESETSFSFTMETIDMGGSLAWQIEPAETIELDHDLKFLDIDRTVVEHKYGALNPKGYLRQITTAAARLEIRDDGYEELKKEIEKIFDKDEALYEDHYNEMLPVFLSDLEKGKEDLSELSASNYIEVYRADSKIVSFYYHTGWSENFSDGKIDGESSQVLYNFHSETGKKVTLDEVVADKKTLCDCIRNSRKMAYYDDEATTEEICQAVMDGSIQFGLTLDGIVLTPESGYLRFSAVNYPGVFHMKYFQSVPENYMLISDDSGVITWDLNGDGKTESIGFPSPMDAVDADFAVIIGEVETIFKGDSRYDRPEEGDYFCLVHNDDGFLLLTGGNYGSEDRCENIFRIKDNFTVEYVETGKICSAQSDDPSKVEMMSIDEFSKAGYFGERQTYSSFTLTGKRTLQSKDVQIYDQKGSVMVTLKDIKCKILEGKDTWKDYTLPKDSSVCTTGYDPQTKELILEVLHPDEKENRTVRVFYDGVGGTVDPFELFTGMPYGG
ncbi:MAG: hypothetical protein K6A81_05355 [Clostridiales bacterium]|nr:hypothetical protein [Clostridiales bacterium]